MHPFLANQRMVEALPMWRRVDPLAVLALSSEERKRREKDLRDAESAENREEQKVAPTTERCSGPQSFVR